MTHHILPLDELKSQFAKNFKFDFYLLKLHLYSPVEILLQLPFLINFKFSTQKVDIEILRESDISKDDGEIIFGFFWILYCNGTISLQKLIDTYEEFHGENFEDIIYERVCSNFSEIFRWVELDGQGQNQT